MTPTGGSHGKLHRTTKIVGRARRCGGSVPARGAAQQRGFPVIGLLSSRSPAVDMPLLAVIRPGLIETGLVEGQNVAVCTENVVRFDWLIESLGGGVPRQGCSI